MKKLFSLLTLALLTMSAWAQTTVTFVPGETVGSNTGATVPFVTTRAIDRFYFVEDSLHNTYGSPIWATSVGKAKLNQATAQKQQGWNTTWTDGGKSCKLYMLDEVKATGWIPSAQVSNVGYEPYMFRLFVKSKNGNLRNYTYETNSDGNKVITAKETSEAGIPRSRPTRSRWV